MKCFMFSDSLASDSDSYLKQKLVETERELDTAERKVKDLQLRLKRFAKDDQLKDEKISQMEKESKEMSDHVKKLEQSLADSQGVNNNNAAMQASSPKNDSIGNILIFLLYEIFAQDFHVFFSEKKINI